MQLYVYLVCLMLFRDILQFHCEYLDSHMLSNQSVARLGSVGHLAKQVKINYDCFMFIWQETNMYILY